MTSPTLTHGNIKKQLITLAIPLIIGNIMQQLYNTIDAMVIGRFAGSEAFGAIGVAGTVMNLFIFMLSGACTGISVILAQLYGAGKYNLFRREVFLSLTLGGVLTLAISLAGIMLLNPLLALIQTPQAVADYARSYLLVILSGLISTYLYNLCAALLRSIGNTQTALYILIAAMLTNLVLDVLFVAVLKLGIAGAAWATVLSQSLSAIVCFIYLKKIMPDLIFQRKDMVYDRELLKQTIHFGAVSALHQSSLYIGKLLVQGSVNTMGTEMISAYTATTRIEGFANSFGDSGAAAMSVFIAQNVGNKQWKRSKKGFLTGILLLGILGITLSALMFLLAPHAVTLMIGQATENELFQGSAYLKTISIFYLLCFFGNGFVGYFRGIGKVNLPVIVTTLHISLRAVFSCLLIGTLGLAGVAIATGIGWILVMIIYLPTWFKVTRKMGL